MATGFVCKRLGGDGGKGEERKEAGREGTRGNEILKPSSEKPNASRCQCKACNSVFDLLTVDLH